MRWFFFLLDVAGILYSLGCFVAQREGILTLSTFEYGINSLTLAGSIFIIMVMTGQRMLGYNIST